VLLALQNLLLSEKRLKITPRDEWEIVANQGYFVASPYYAEGADLKKSDGFPTTVRWRSLLDKIRTYFKNKYTM